MSKTYGHDGPPQLHGYIADVPPKMLANWIATKSEDVWTFTNNDWWRKLIICPCGASDKFQFSLGDRHTPGWLKGKYAGGERCDIQCAACKRELLFFDENLHGYNAVICEERNQIPPNYIQNNGALLKPQTCDCGHNLFTIIVDVMYDCGEDIEDFPEEQWDDAYGSFGASARCSACGKIRDVIGAETA